MEVGGECRVGAPVRVILVSRTRIGGLVSCCKRGLRGRRVRVLESALSWWKRDGSVHRFSLPPRRRSRGGILSRTNPVRRQTTYRAGEPCTTLPRHTSAKKHKPPQVWVKGGDFNVVALSNGGWSSRWRRLSPVSTNIIVSCKISLLVPAINLYRHLSI